MRFKPIITIDIDDQQFSAFYRLYQQFEEKLEKLPESWKQVNDSGKEATEAFAIITGELVTSMADASMHAKNLGMYLMDASKAQKEFGSNSGVGAKHMKSMAEDARKLGSEIFGIGKFLFKLGAVGVGAAAGSIWGIDKLANSAVANQRNARALGLTTGQYRAFDTDLGRYIDPDTLSSVANAQNDLVGRMWLARATGLSAQGVQGTNAGSLAAQLALKAHDWFVNNPGANDIQHFAATGFGQAGLGYDQVRREGNTPRSELERGLAAYQNDSRSLNYGASAVNALYDFSNKLRLAGQHLETDLADKLSQLNKSGALSGFITNLEKDAEILINGVLTPANLKAAQEGLTTFATYLGSPDFKKSAMIFASGVERIAHALGWAAGKAEEIRHPKAGSTAENADWWGNEIWDNMAHVGSVLWNPAHHLKKLMDESYHPGNNPGNLRAAAGVASINGFANFQSQQDGYAAMAALLGSYPTKYHADTLSGIINTYAPAKDHNNDEAYIANVSKWAGFQPDQKLNLYDPAIISKLIAAMVRQEKGWKVTPDQVRDDIAHAHWKTPQGSSDDIKRLMAALAKQQSKPVHVAITNKTGNNVAVSINAASL